MQISLIALTTLACATGSLSAAIQARDLHTKLWCVDVTPAQNFNIGEEVTENNAATPAACAAYKNRNAGTNPQDTCPDCVAVTDSRNGFVTCNSAAKHLGGNEMTDFCKAAGADRGQA
ncbi:hypothetical protein B0J14DRAFT_646644 [Halenospora varia]|nr:hypothetical protein B0J14DRAFT_646644 [Halenospora varia]